MQNAMKTTRTLMGFAMFLILVPATHAQFTWNLSGEGGSASNTFGNGSSDTTPVWGASLGAVLAGSTKKNSLFRFLFTLS